MRPIYWALIGLVAVGYVVIRIVLFAGVRRSRLEAWAQLHNYTFEPGRDSTVGQQYARLSRLTLHGNCSATNVVRGTLGPFTFCAFDFVDLDQPAYSPTRRRYRHGPTATSFAAVVVETNLSLPDVVIERESLSSKVASTFGSEDVTLGADEFDKRFVVRSPDRERAVEVLGPVVQQLLMDTPLFEFASSLRLLQFHGPFVLARSRDDQFFSEADYPDVLALLAAVLKAVVSNNPRRIDAGTTDVID